MNKIICMFEISSTWVSMPKLIIMIMRLFTWPSVIRGSPVIRSFTFHCVLEIKGTTVFLVAYIVHILLTTAYFKGYVFSWGWDRTGRGVLIRLWPRDAFLTEDIIIRRILKSDGYRTRPWSTFSAENEAIF
jgi:hypothetical protein